MSETAPSAGSRFWRWLKHGRGVGSRGSAVYLQAPEPRWWSFPVRTWRMLARHRTILPTPLLYVVVAGVGLAVGVVLQLTVGVWWWLPPILLLIVAWLVFFSSIWWRPGARGGSLRVELLSAVDPQRGFEARRREQLERVRAAGIPLFEIESWPGIVRLVGWGGEAGRITHVAVGFVDEEESPVAITVTTITAESEREEHVRDRLLGELTGRRVDARMPPLAAPDAMRDAHLRLRDELRASTWMPVTIRIDGKDHRGAGLRAHGVSAAYCAVGDVWATIVTPADADLRLRRIVDPDRVIDATLSLG